MIDRQTTGGRLVVDALRSLGVQHVFGVPGGQTLAILDAMLDVEDIRFVAVRHEGAAACMADAVGRLTGRPGVCLATTGPGATNLLTGVGGAFRDSSPVIVITCNNNLRDIDRDDAQAADHVAIFRPLTKRAMFVGTPAAIPQVIEEAYIIAMSGCPGPVLVDFARDALETGVTAVPAMPGEKMHLLRAIPRSSADPSVVSRAAAQLQAASSPVLWLGGGTIRSGATDAALRLAERLDAPVITTFNGIGAAPSAHPNVFGPKSRMGTALSAAVLRGADVVLAVGNSLDAVSTSRWTVDLPECIIQIDTDPEKLGRYYASRTLGLLGDARLVLEQLNDRMDGNLSTGTSAEARKARLSELAHERERWQSRLADSRSRPGMIAPDRLVKVLRDATPDDTVLVVDAGNAGVWTHLWEVRDGAGEYLKPVGFGNMGFALPAAIGSALVRPSSHVVALIGDGSMAMTVGELETVAREGVAPCIVVMNDSSYGNIRQEQLVKYGPRTSGVDFRDVDFAQIAKGFGVKGVRVDSEEGLAAAVREWLSAGEALLIDARIDRDPSVWTFPYFTGSEPET